MLERAELLREHGANEVVREKSASPLRLLLTQFESPVIWLLLGACAVAAWLGETVDSIAIGVIVVVNALVGFFQEFRAERAVLALRSMTAPRARVLREGRSLVIPAFEVVPDDVLLLEAGDVVAADGQLLEANSLLVNESVLTGESAPAEKSTQDVPADAPTRRATQRGVHGNRRRQRHGPGPSRRHGNADRARQDRAPFGQRPLRRDALAGPPCPGESRSPVALPRHRGDGRRAGPFARHATLGRVPVSVSLAVAAVPRVSRPW